MRHTMQFATSLDKERIARVRADVGPDSGGRWVPAFLGQSCRGARKEGQIVNGFSIFSVLALALAVPVGTSLAAITSFTDQATWQSAAGSWDTVGFEGFLGPVSTQYAGVTFGGFNGGSPYAAAIFPHGGQNSMLTVYLSNAGGGGWAATFGTPVRAFGFWSDDVQFTGSTISIFDSGSTLLGTYDLMGSGGGHGPYLYGFNGFFLQHSRHC